MKRIEIPLVNAKSNKQFGTLAIFSVGRKAFLYAERWNKTHTSKFTGLIPFNTQKAAMAKADEIVNAVKSGGFFKISQEAHQNLVTYREAKAAAQPKAQAQTKSKGKKPLPQVIF